MSVLIVVAIQIGNFSQGHRLAPSCSFFEEKYLTEDNLYT